VGFMFLDRYQSVKNCTKWTSHSTYMWSQCTKSERIYLVKPMTYMNLSGEAVYDFMKPRQIELSDIIVVYDDVSLPLGKIRIREAGSSGGHKGLQSVMDHLETDNITRLRIGIGPKPEDVSTADFVLEDFSETELHVLDAVLDMAIEAVDTVLFQGASRAMTLFNSKEVIL